MLIAVVLQFNLHNIASLICQETERDIGFFVVLGVNEVGGGGGGAASDMFV